jgi:hypothetical protein
MHGRISLGSALLLIVLVGCADEEPAHDHPGQAIKSVPPAAGMAFDESSCGTIEGQVTWHGSVSEVAPFRVLSGPDNLPPNKKRLTYEPNPYRPLVDSAGGVRDVVVFLRHVDPQHAGPWRHGPVCVEQIERRIQIAQDGMVSRYGFVRPGDTISAVNRDVEYHALRARGAAFFTLPFADTDTVTQRRLDKAGTVELISGAGYYWMHALLFVVEHPYYTRTDATGRFRLEQVPAGSYDLVCWMPNWEVASRERDPESGFIARLVFERPLQQVRRVEVQPGARSQVRFRW